MRWLIERVLLGLLVAALALFAGDWAVWRARVAEGEGTRRLEVSRMQVAALKGNKVEYYSVGSAEVDCSRSIFPLAAAGACWWVERHRVMFEH